jgi:gentisate 1,2-dioxygenase
MYMYPGNLLIQPNFAWHDHTDNSNEQIIRIDALDSGLVTYLLTASFREVPLGIYPNASSAMLKVGT